MKKIFLIACAVIVAIVFVAPQMTLAQTPPQPNGGSTSTITQPPTASTTTNLNNPSSAGNTLFNPIAYNNLADLIIGITNTFTGVLAIVSVAFVVLGGAELIISSGNEEAVKKGKSTITWAVIGLILAFLAFSIVAIVENLLGVH